MKRRPLSVPEALAQTQDGADRWALPKAAPHLAIFAACAPSNRPRSIFRVSIEVRATGDGPIMEAKRFLELRQTKY